MLVVLNQISINQKIVVKIAINNFAKMYQKIKYLLVQTRNGNTLYLIFKIIETRL